MTRRRNVKTYIVTTTKNIPAQVGGRQIETQQQQTHEWYYYVERYADKRGRECSKVGHRFRDALWQDSHRQNETVFLKHNGRTLSDPAAGRPPASGRPRRPHPRCWYLLFFPLPCPTGYRLPERARPRPPWRPPPRGAPRGRSGSWWRRERRWRRKRAAQWPIMLHVLCCLCFKLPDNSTITQRFLRCTHTRQQEGGSTPTVHSGPGRAFWIRGPRKASYNIEFKVRDRLPRATRAPRPAPRVPPPRMHAASPS